tara:strand:+ start:75096 stop:75932 length:837 start_codon:yes stop_codon:yes gene_type:complete
MSNSVTLISENAVLSVIVPVYNEAGHLGAIIDYMFESPCVLKREWIFINDSSTDSSLTILKEKQAQYGFILIEQSPNQGKGAAIQRGIKACTGDLVVIQDADFEYDPQDVPSLLVPLLENRADVVFGSRFKKSSPQVHRTYHYFVNRFLTVLSNLSSGLYLTDMETCYKVFRGDLIRSMNLQSKRFGFEVEVTAYIAKTSSRVFELPIHYYPRTRLQGKKINWKDGVAALCHIFKFNFMIPVEKMFTDLPSKYDFDAHRASKQRKEHMYASGSREASK